MIYSAALKIINEDNNDKRARNGHQRSGFTKGSENDPDAHLQNLILYKLANTVGGKRVSHLRYENVAHGILQIPRDPTTYRWANYNNFRSSKFQCGDSQCEKRQELEDGLANFMADKFTGKRGEQQPYDQQRVYACIHILAKFTTADTSKILNVCNIIRTIETKTEVDAIRKYLNYEAFKVGGGAAPLNGGGRFKFDYEQDPEKLGEVEYNDDENEAADPSWFNPGTVMVLLFAIVVAAGGFMQLKKLGYLSCVGLKGDATEDPELVERDLTAIRRSIRQSERRASVAQGRGGKSLKKSLFDFMPKPRASSRATGSSVSPEAPKTKQKLKEPLNPASYRDLEMASSNAGSRAPSKERSARSRERTDRRMGGGAAGQV